ncbi:hypothetical protein [Phytomonospora endophytica]|uniref:Uncharacterized protein n=1 Tax=Phytomonospora endophytica TaxID=714109 RepID=A0A841FFI3_9ACTN|nr:hypothetical protein [Phytomonospora endophytica]MBB6033763.1 hypothetical protein [Phytomonospora endophytica]GIG64720.1 hypothetical protein Pen01_10150 [Phytomonospora endophytica]
MAVVVDWSAIASAHVEQTTTHNTDAGEAQTLGTGICADCLRSFPGGPARMAEIKRRAGWVDHER